MKHTAAAFLSGLLMVSSAALAATTLWVKVGEQPENFLGYGACGGLDYDNDGLADVLAAADYDAGRNGSAGKVYIWSGANQSLLFSAVGEGKSNGFGGAGAPAGRVNGDAIDDFVVAAPGFNNGFGKLYVYGGGTGTLLFSKLGKSLGLSNTAGFGTTSSRPGDFNGDGRADVAAAAAQQSNQNGRVYVWSGLDASQLLLLNGASGGRFGSSLAFADVNDDGFDDLVIGEPQSAGGVGRVHVRLGPSGAPASFSPIAGQNGFFGGNVASLGDFTGDGIDDFAVSAPNYTGSLSVQGKVYVYSGADGSLAASISGSAASQSLGIRLAAAGDFNHDGLGDVALQLAGNPRRVQVFAGPDLGSGVPLVTYSQPTVSFGNNFCSAGDTNGDLFDELVIASPADAQGGPFAGKIYVESFVP